MLHLSKMVQVFGQCSLLFLMIGFLGACTNKTTYKVDGTTYSVVKIKDSGELYSTYEMGAEDEEALKKQGLSGSKIETVKKMANEDNWPSGIATLDAREENRPKIKEYMTYKVAEFDGKSLLIVPSSRNQKMPEKMRPSKDIYFIIGNTGL